jgi:hypothetical protein
MWVNILFVMKNSTQFSFTLLGSPGLQLTKLTGVPSDQAYPEEVEISLKPIQKYELTAYFFPS